MLNSFAQWNFGWGGTFESGQGSEVGKEIFDGVDSAVRQVNAMEELEEEIVVEGVESFFEVNKENIVVFLISAGGVIIVIE